MSKFENQKLANILAFLTAEEYVERKKNLESICRAMENTEVTWGLAMSSALFFRGIVDDFNDFDIVIDINDVGKFEEAFKEIEGASIDENTRQKAAFASAYYREATINGFHCDLIADWKVCTFGTTFTYSVKQQDIKFQTIDGGLTIPLSPVEANFLLYGMMIGWQSRRIFKKELCFRYLYEVGIRYRNVFERTDKSTISRDLQNEIELLDVL